MSYVSCDELYRVLGVRPSVQDIEDVAPKCAAVTDNRFPLHGGF